MLAQKYGLAPKLIVAGCCQLLYTAGTIDIYEVKQ
jgi:hypothetical protein